mgnify:CR=1 FL=1
MTRHITLATVVILCTAICCADTFKHRETGEVFNGFATQKSIGNRTRVYNADLKTFKPLVLGQYDVTPNARGRRNNVIVMPLKQAEVLLSKAVSEALANAIVDASNKGPRFIVIEIDNPGGRGEYMKHISTTITKTFNCPTVAYISGGTYGGAYSAATAVALACDKIYIAPQAVMGSVAPPVGMATGHEDPQSAVETYSPKNLSAYNSYVAALAEQNNRPGAIAMAMLDRSIEVIEVADKNGKRSFINRADRRPDQSIVRSLTRTTGQGAEAVLTLTPSDAVAGGIAEKVVGSLPELLTDMGAADAKLIRGGQVDKTIRKFIAARRNLGEILASIDYLQKRADELESQLNEREKQELQNTRQREYRRDSSGRRSSRIYSYDGDIRRRRGRGETEIVTRSEPMVDTLRLRDELALVLNDLIIGYNKAIALARRWPGALPQNMTLRTLEQRLISAQTLQNDVVFRRGGIVAPGAGVGPGGRLNRGTGYNR